MRKRFSLLSIAALGLFISGCLDTNDTFFINPDGSGKVIHEAVLEPFDLELGEKLTQEQKLRKTIKNELEEAEGVEVWKDVTYKRLDEKKIYFKGTAYFKDLSKLKFYNIGTSVSFLDKISLTQDDDQLILELKSSTKKNEAEAEEKLKPSLLSDEDILKKVEEERVKYEQSKPMLMALLPMLKIKKTFGLPGELKEFTNFKKLEDGSLQNEFNGETFLKFMDEKVKDDEWMKAQIKSGGDFQNGLAPAEDDQLNQFLFGEPGPIRAVSRGHLKPLFDYSSEVVSAKENYSTIIKELGIKEKVVVFAGEAGEFKVGGVRIITISDQENDVRPFNYDTGYELSIIGTLPHPALNVKGGTLEVAMDNNGGSLLPEKEWDRKIHFVRLGKDKKTVVFEVKMMLPKEDVKGFKEISGTLDYVVGSTTKKYDLGIEEFKPEITGTGFGAVIKSIKFNEWGDNKDTLALKLDLSVDSVKSAEFYNQSGEKLDVKQSGYSSMGEVTTFNFSLKEGKYPEKGKIIVEIFEDLKTYTVSFKLENISLLGRPL